MGFFRKKHKTWQELKAEEDKKLEILRLEEEAELEKIRQETERIEQVKSYNLPEKKINYESSELTNEALEVELKKYPRKRRKKLRKLYNQYKRGQVLRPCENIDNKEYISSRE